uniref:LysM domain-containing protein n=1 Tax=Rhabditophanes sp. KR3021 TaxID=114890 RepID=A0AC35TMM1_9BILA
MEYEVKTTDTLAGIAAANDCTISELAKLNRLQTRTVFAGQKIKIPLPGQPIVIRKLSVQTNKEMKAPNDSIMRKSSGGVGLPPRSFSVNESKSADGIRKGPGGVIPVQAGAYARQNNQNPLAKTQSVPVSTKAMNQGDTFEDDTDCLQRFLKIKVKQVTESDGTVPGTLLVTPNCVMFDPHINHALVRENGQDLYGMIANMEDINSVAVYNDIRDLTGERPSDTRKDGLFDPDHVKTPPRQISPCTDNNILSRESNNPEIIEGQCIFTTGNNSDTEESFKDSSLLNSSNTQLPLIEEEEGTDNKKERLLVAQRDKRRTVSDLTNDQTDTFANNNVAKEEVEETSSLGIRRQRASSERQSTSSLDSNSGSPFSRISPNMARRSFGKLGRTLSQRATSLKDSVQSAGQTVANSTKIVAHGVVHHTKSAADQIQTGIQTSAKIVANAPSNLVQKGSELVKEGQSMVDSIFSVESLEPEKSIQAIKREQSMAKLDSLRQNTEEVRKSIAKNVGTSFVCGTKKEERPELFASINSLGSLHSNHSANEELGSPQEPYYMIVRLNRKTIKKTRKGSRKSTIDYESLDDDSSAFGNRRKREFWFAVPRAKADAIYHFLLQWSPDKYGHDAVAPTEEVVKKPTYDGRGFIILNGESDETINGEKNAPLFGGNSLMNREWEIVTVDEMCRRLSLEDALEPSEMPLPEGATSSQMLDEFMIRQVCDILPARAEGYPWINVFSSDKNGFSLSTFYRKMAEFGEEMSPILLLIRDTRGHVFGAVVSTPIQIAEHYYGTGDSCILFRFTGEYPHTRELRQYTWTGANQFFINATKEYLSIGAGQGYYGLWLDADLNIGRSQKCATFDNELLAGGESEEFVVQFIEAFGFAM